MSTYDLCERAKTDIWNVWTVFLVLHFICSLPFCSSLIIHMYCTVYSCIDTCVENHMGTWSDRSSICPSVRALLLDSPTNCSERSINKKAIQQCPTPQLLTATGVNMKVWLMKDIWPFQHWLVNSTSRFSGQEECQMRGYISIIVVVSSPDPLHIVVRQYTAKQHRVYGQHIYHDLNLKGVHICSCRGFKVWWDVGCWFIMVPRSAWWSDLASLKWQLNYGCQTAEHNVDFYDFHPISSLIDISFNLVRFKCLLYFDVLKLLVLIWCSTE